MNKIGIIGAGASGIMAAIQAAENGACVTLFEKKENIGKKLLVTGNGRCNFTNLNMSSSYYYCDNTEDIDRTFDNFGNKELIHFFMSRGLMIKDRNGYVYPACDQASSVLEILQIALKQYNVNVITDCDITEIRPLNTGFEIISSQGISYCFDKVILASGGRSSLSKGERANGYDILRKLGIKYSRLYPALTQIKCSGLNFRNISGVRQDCEMKIYIENELLMLQKGEVLFTDNGVSGIVSFQVSHLAAQSLYEQKNVKIILDMFEGISYESLLDFANTKILLYPDASVSEFLTGFLNKKLNAELISLVGLTGNEIISSLEKEIVFKLIFMMKNLELTVIGTGDFDKSQVTGGGVSLTDLTESFETKIYPGLYIVGELLDVDGLCGGYNLQWAFSTGYLAGISASTSK